MSPAHRPSRYPVLAGTSPSLTTPAATAPGGFPEEFTVPGLDRFNTLPPGAAEEALLACCGSRRWARRLAAHRPYPDLAALLAAADEASYDLAEADLGEALARESAPGLPGLPLPRARSGDDRLPALTAPRDSCVPAVPGGPPGPARRPGALAAHTALRAAHAAYESRFGHAFVICMDGVPREESLDHVLGGIRARLGHDRDDERAVVAGELRRLAGGRLERLVTRPPKA